MKLLCCFCLRGKKKEAEFIYIGYSYCREHYYKQLVFEGHIDKCGKELAENQNHKHLKVKEKK